MLRVGQREADTQHGRILRTDLQGWKDADREDGNDRRIAILGFGVRGGVLRERGKREGEEGEEEGEAFHCGRGRGQC